MKHLRFSKRFVCAAAAFMLMCAARYLPAQQPVFPSRFEIPACHRDNPETAGSDHELRELTSFSLCYRESYEQAEWAAYILKKEYLTQKSVRTNNFRADSEITTGSAVPDDYRKSGYDRGHLVPAFDMSRDVRSMSDSFFMSNMSPQIPSFNRGIWLRTESAGRKWAEVFGSVCIVTGPLLEKAPEAYAAIGHNRVSVPEFYYKIFLAYTGSSAVSGDSGLHTDPAAAAPEVAGTPAGEDLEAFHIPGTGWYVFACIIPNAPVSGQTYTGFSVCIAEIERRTGIDFFPLLDAVTAQKIETFRTKMPPAGTAAD